VIATYFAGENKN